MQRNRPISLNRLRNWRRFVRFLQFPWGRRAYPELKYFETDRDGYLTLEEAHRNVVKGRHFWLVTVILAAGSCVTYLALLPVLVGHTVLHIGVSVALGILGADLTNSVFLRRNIRRHLRAKLAEQGVPLCIPCGYDLRGETEPRCPECGAAFDPALLNVGPDHP